MSASSPIAAARRNHELGLVLMVAVITGCAYILAALGRDANVPANLGPFLGVIVLLIVGAHVATRILAKGADAVLLPLAALLNGIGFVMLARLDAKRLAGLQATWTLIGVAAYVLTLLVVRRANDLGRYQWTFFIIGAGLLVMPFVPGVGQNFNGARIWVSIGPINFQPGEFAKIALALFFAGYLTEHRELISAGTWRVGPFNLPEPRHLLPLVLPWSISVLVMIGQKDLGSSLLFFTLFVIMLWVATEKASFLAIGTVLFVGGAYFAWRSFAHVQDRVNIWLDPWSRYEGKGYQIVQASFALGSGELGGTGLGLGTPGKIPEAKNDFIFAAIGEELGLFGATAILLAFVLIIGAGFRTALRADRPFEKLLAVGLTTIIGVQSFIIIAGVIRVLPLTGVTLPFVSYGGSSLVANYVLLALLMRVSDSSARRLGEVPDVPGWAEMRAAKRYARATFRTESEDTVVASTMERGRRRHGDPAAPSDAWVEDIGAPEPFPGNRRVAAASDATTRFDTPQIPPDLVDDTVSIWDADAVTGPIVPPPPARPSSAVPPDEPDTVADLPATPPPPPPPRGPRAPNHRPDDEEDWR